MVQGRVDAGPERVENRGWNSLSIGSTQCAGVGRLDGTVVQWCSGAVVKADAKRKQAHLSMGLFVYYGGTELLSLTMTYFHTC